jgi:hypothetical protein
MKKKELGCDAGASLLPEKGLYGKDRSWKKVLWRSNA